MATTPIARPRARVTTPVGPLAPISTSANAIVSRAITHKLIDYHNAKSECGSLRWRSFCELEIKLALDAAVATLTPASRA
jgi:hypothetical protein